MPQAWQDSWIFRIVDQDTGAALPGVPVTVLDNANRSAGFWVSDADGVVQIPKHDAARLRLRVGLRSEDTIELDARSLPDDPIPLAAPQSFNPSQEGLVPVASVAAVAPAPVTPVDKAMTGHVVRFARIGIASEDASIVSPEPGASEADAGTVRYGVVFEVDQVWQSLGTEAGDLLYSISVGPGDEARIAVSDGRWRRKPDGRERSVYIVSRMVAARVLGDGVDAAPLEPFVVTDLKAAAGDTVRFLSDRTLRASSSLRRRPLGVTEVIGEVPPDSAVRTVRNTRAEGVLTYQFIEPVARYRVMVRAPHARPALLVPFRLPNLATREVVRRFGHALRRAVLDRALLPDIEHLLTAERPVDSIEQRVYAHIAANLAYYSATIIAAGDPAERFFALAKLRDAEGHPLTDIIENTVVGRVGNHVAFPLRSADFTTSAWRLALADRELQRVRVLQEVMVTLPVPGVWLRSHLTPAQLEQEVPVAEAPEVERREERRTIARRRPGG
jgi:hypothetical protein